MTDQLLPHEVIRELPIIYSFGAEKPDLVNPTVEVRLILLECLDTHVVQNLTLARVVVGHQFPLELVCNRRHSVRMVVKKTGRQPIRF